MECDYGCFLFLFKVGGERVMSGKTTDEKIGLFKWNRTVEKMMKEMKEDNAELKKENAELKEAKEFYEKMSAGWNHLWRKITNSPVPVGFARDDTFTDCLRKLYNYIETCQPVMLEVESARIMYARMNVTHMSSASNARIVELLTEEAEELYQVRISLVNRVLELLKHTNGDTEQEKKDWEQFSRVHSVNDQLNYMMKVVHNQYRKPVEEAGNSDCEDVRTISIKSTFIPGKHIRRQNWIVSANRASSFHAFCNLTGKGLFEEYYIGVDTVDKQTSIVVSLENAIFLDAIWHYMQELKIKSGYLYKNLKQQIQSNDCTQDMSYTVWNRFMAHELKYTLNMRPEIYKHLQDPVSFKTFNSENDEEYDRLKTRMVNTLDGITDNEMKLKASQITLIRAADFFWAVRNNDWRQNYFIPFDLQQSPIVTKGLLHSMRTDATFDDTMQNIQEQYRLQNQATYVPGDTSDTEGQNSATECVVCMTEEATHACLPCGHKCMCETCASLVLHTTGSCPMCRKEVTNTIQIFGKRFNPFMIELPV